MYKYLFIVFVILDDYHSRMELTNMTSKFRLSALIWGALHWNQVSSVGIAALFKCGPHPFKGQVYPKISGQSNNHKLMFLIFALTPILWSPDAVLILCWVFTAELPVCSWSVLGAFMWCWNNQKNEFLTGKIHMNAASSRNNNSESRQKFWYMPFRETCHFLHGQHHLCCSFCTSTMLMASFTAELPYFWANTDVFMINMCMF